MAAGACTGAPYALVLPLLSFQENTFFFLPAGSAKGRLQRVAWRPHQYAVTSYQQCCSCVQTQASDFLHLIE